MSPQRKKVFLKLLENKRAYWLGEVSKNELLKLVSSFDIGLIPYKKTLFNINSFPMKVMEYFYLGMPIISSNIKELERFNDHVYFPEKDGWKDLNDFLKKSEDKSVEKKKIALMNSWYKKVSLILQCLG